MAFRTAVMMDGCPHCGDGEPKIVTYYHRKVPDQTEFIGAFIDSEKEALLEYGELRIISCRPLDAEDEQDDA